MPGEINFFTEDISYTLKHKTKLRQWIHSIVQSENRAIEEINYIFCSDDYLLNINRQYLNHDYYTDIITFDNTDDYDPGLCSDIYISIDRVKDNARRHQSNFSTELHRVMIHGILHLLGQGDKTPEQKQAMRKREEACLSLLHI